MSEISPARAAIAGAKRLVVKIGSSSLSSREGGLKLDAIAQLAGVVAQRRARGDQVVVVSSGAI